jgi:hypothetical protein
MAGSRAGLGAAIPAVISQSLSLLRAIAASRSGAQIFMS